LLAQETLVIMDVPRQNSTRDKRERRHLSRLHRSGAAAAEFAICLPFLLAIAFGTIETTNAVFVRRSLAAAAYEGGNVASSIGGTSTVAISRATDVCRLLGVNAVTVTVSPSVDTNTATGTPITVTCTANLESNTVTGWCIGNRTLTASCTVIHL
jgi:Flp pilus assembly protein TadG